MTVCTSSKGEKYLPLSWSFERQYGSENFTSTCNTLQSCQQPHAVLFPGAERNAVTASGLRRGGQAVRGSNTERKKYYLFTKLAGRNVYLIHSLFSECTGPLTLKYGLEVKLSTHWECKELFFHFPIRLHAVMHTTAQWKSVFKLMYETGQGNILYILRKKYRTRTFVGYTILSR